MPGCNQFLERKKNGMLLFYQASPDLLFLSVLCALIQPYKCRRIHVFLAILLCFGIAALAVLALRQCGIAALSLQFRYYSGIADAPAFGILALSALCFEAVYYIARSSIMSSASCLGADFIAPS